MPETDRLSNYIDVLVEKAQSWQDFGEQILEILRSDDQGKLLEVVDRRETIIKAYIDCLQRCTDELHRRGLVFQAESVFPFLLELSGSDPVYSCFQGRLIKLRNVLENTRSQESEVLDQATRLPQQLRGQLLKVQTQKAGIQAYQKNRSMAYAGFSRFERKK
jgi:hypothetical protein